jgi:hypothetical protein
VSSANQSNILSLFKSTKLITNIQGSTLARPFSVPHKSLNSMAIFLEKASTPVHDIDNLVEIYR